MRLQGLVIRAVGPALVLAPVAAVAAGGPADRCTDWSDRDRVLLFGTLPLGAPVAAANGMRAEPGCLVPEGHRFVDCEFRDHDGLACLFDMDGLVRIEARRADIAKPVVLPLGLAFGMDRSAVRARLAWIPLVGLRTLLRQQLDSGAQGIATPVCVRGAKGEAGSWFLTFDERGRLQRVGLRLNVG